MTEKIVFVPAKTPEQALETAQTTNERPWVFDDRGDAERNAAFLMITYPGTDQKVFKVKIDFEILED